ncbi:hypothetical protein [Verrucomicrobium spinosum]|nr:hypothetical protein [Verrucomicrobium spinosum]
MGERDRREGAEAPVERPQVLLKAVAALEGSGVAELTSGERVEGGVRARYHLKEARYLGALSWKEETLVLVTALYIRFRNPGSDVPPARGHFFVVCLDAEASKVVAHTRLELADCHLDGEILKLGDQAADDFGNHDDLTRYRGYLIGGALLPYPYKDRITEAEWEAGTFRKQSR